MESERRCISNSGDHCKCYRTGGRCCDCSAQIESEWRSRALKAEQEAAALRQERDEWRLLCESAEFKVADRDQQLAALREELAAAKEEICDLYDEIDKWKAASGLTIGGDPADVEPAHVSKHVGDMDVIVRAFVDVAEHGMDCDKWVGLLDERWLADERACTCGLDAVLARVAALPRED